MKTVLKKLKSTEQAICVISKMFFFLLSWFLLGIQVHVLTTIVTNYVLVLYYRFYWCQINTVLQLYRYNGIYSCRIWHLYECTFCHAKVAVNNKHCVLCRSSNRNIISVYCQYEEYRVYHFEQRPILMKGLCSKW